MTPTGNAYSAVSRSTRKSMRRTPMQSSTTMRPRIVVPPAVAVRHSDAYERNKIATNGHVAIVPPCSQHHFDLRCQLVPPLQAVKERSEARLDVLARVDAENRGRCGRSRRTPR